MKTTNVDYTSFSCQPVDNTKWSLHYENLYSDGNNIMIENNLLRLKFTYNEGLTYKRYFLFSMYMMKS